MSGYCYTRNDGSGVGIACPWPQSFARSRGGRGRRRVRKRPREPRNVPPSWSGWFGRAEFVHLYLILPDGTRRQLQYVGGIGVAPGRLLPFIVPMMAGSVYSIKTPLRNWRLGSNLDPVEAELSRRASLQAEIVAGESLQRDYANCYDLQIFWSGSAHSNIVRP